MTTLQTLCRPGALVAAVSLALCVAPAPAEAQVSGGILGFRLYELTVDNSSGPDTLAGVLVVVGDSDYTDGNSVVWEADTEYWIWDSGAWPTSNSNGDDGFLVTVAATQSDIDDYDPGDADAYNNDPFTTFDDDVSISGGSKRYKVWRVPNTGSDVLVGYAKVFAPSMDTHWYGYGSQVNLNGYWQLGGGDKGWWFEPTTATFTEDNIDELQHTAM